MYYLLSVRLVVPPRTSALQTAEYVWRFPVRPPANTGAYIHPEDQINLSVSLVTQSPN